MSSLLEDIEGVVVNPGVIQTDNDEAGRNLIDNNGIFSKLIEVNKPYYNIIKMRPRGNWANFRTE